MLFTIIVPAYNAERHLIEAIESVLCQSFHDFELVVVDDGSSDATPRLLDELSELHECIRVVHSSNQGPLLARRTGLFYSTGDYIVFLDADDCLRFDALEIIAKSIKDHHPDIISFYYSRNDDFSTNDCSSTIAVGQYSGDSYIRVKECICEGRSNALWGKAISRTCFDLDEDYSSFSGLMHGEDLFQLMPIIDRASSFIQLNSVLYFYRPNEHSNTALFKNEQLSNIAAVNKRLLKYAAEWGGNCLKISYSGEIGQYLYLLKISQLSPVSRKMKKANFNNIAMVMNAQGVLSRANKAKLRIDNRLLVHSLKEGNYLLARSIISFVELLK